MLARQTLQPTDDGQAQGVAQQRLIDVAPWCLIRVALSPRIQKFALCAPSRASTRSTCFPVQGAKCIPCCAMAATTSANRARLLSPLLYEEGAVHVRDDEFDHAVTSDVCILIAVIISPQ